jgi:hypothetical protein
MGFCLEDFKTLLSGMLQKTGSLFKRSKRALKIFGTFFIAKFPYNDINGTGDRQGEELQTGLG